MVPEEIQGFAIQQLPNATHQTFNEATLKKAQEDGVVSVRCAKYLTPYAAAVRAEDEAMVETQGSDLSKAIREWDGRRDVTYDSLLKIVKAMNALPNPASKAAAAKVLNYVHINKVNTQAQYDEETGKLTNFIQDMETYCGEELAQLGLGQMLAELKEANERMKELLAERADEYADRVLSRVQKARKVVDEHYRTLVKAVNCMVFLDAPLAEFQPFVGYMNAEITRLKRQVLKVHVSQKEETGTEGGVEAPGETPGGGDGSGSEGSSTEGGSGSNGGSTGGAGTGSNTGSGSGTNGGSGSNGGGEEGTVPGGSVAGGSGSNETPTDPTKILLLFNDGAHGNEIVKRMEVAPGYQLSAADLPEGYVYAFKADDQADIDAASPGDAVWVTLAPRS